MGYLDHRLADTGFDSWYDVEEMYLNWVRFHDTVNEKDLV